jgi:hypothetical protein
MNYLEMESDDNSVLSDESLRLVLLLCGQSVKDKMLYRGDYYYSLRLSGGDTPSIERGNNVVFRGSNHPCDTENKG